MSTTPNSSPDPSLIIERVELAFPELVPGFEVQERDLVFDGRAVGDLLASAPGCALLISCVDGESDEAVLRALDGLALARSHESILHDSLPQPIAGFVRVVLVSDRFSSRQIERLEPLRGEHLWLIRRRELRSQRGSLTRLEVLGEEPRGASSTPRSELPEWATRGPLRSFLARIAPDRLELALHTFDRIRRIDPHLEWVQDGEEVVCRLGSVGLCRMDWTEGHLELRLEDSDISHAIRDEAAIDLILDWLLTAYLEVLDGPASPREETVIFDPPPTSPFEAPLPGDEAPPEDIITEDPAEPVGEDLRELELRPMPPGPLLTAEELRAFHD